MVDQNRSGPEPPPCHNCGSDTVESRHAGVYACTDCQRTLTLDVKTHVKEKRWPERSDDPELSVLVAWREGVQMDETAREEHGLFGDEIRYHHGTTTVLIRKDVGITTTIDYRTARLGIKCSVVKALVRADVDNAIITEAVRMGGISEEQYRMLEREADVSPPNSHGTVPLGGGCTVDELLEKGKL